MPNKKKREIVVQACNINKIYDMGEIKVHALKKVNFKVHEGDFISIMGASGSGKSTLLNILGCLDTPSKGQYYIDSQDVSTLNDDQLSYIRNSKIGFVFQSFNLLSSLTVFDNIKLPLTYRHEDSQIDRRKIKKAIDTVGLSHRINYQPTKLSGGEKQRVAIARAIVTEPVILLADEPTGNLDSKTGKNIMDIFVQLNKLGVTIMLITHENNIAAYGHRLIKLKDGEIIQDSKI